MGCSACEEKRRAMAKNSYYSEFNEGTTSSTKSVSNNVSSSTTKNCGITYKMLVMTYQDINKAKDLSTEIKDSIRLQIAEWIQSIRSTCPDEDKYKQIRDKIYGTDLSQDKQE